MPAARANASPSRALVKQPKLLLLDEPLGALDKQLREEMQFELINIQQALGVAFVVVTPDQEEAMTLSNRNQGDARRAHRPYRRADGDLRVAGSRFVAQFIGSANLFEDRVVRSSGPRADRFRQPSLPLVT